MKTAIYFAILFFWMFLWFTLVTLAFKHGINPLAPVGWYFDWLMS